MNRLKGSNQKANESLFLKTQIEKQMDTILKRAELPRNPRLHHARPSAMKF
jgi:hypothetical protein